MRRAAFMDWWETLPLFRQPVALSRGSAAAIERRRTSAMQKRARSLEAWGAHHQAAETVALGVLPTWPPRRFGALRCRRP